MPALPPFQSGQRLHLRPAPAIQRVSPPPTIRLYTYPTISTGKGIRSKQVLGNWTPERTEIRPGLWRRKTGHPHPSAAELMGPANKKLTWLSEKFQLNSIVCYFTTKNTKITKARKNNGHWPFVSFVRFVVTSELLGLST